MLKGALLYVFWVDRDFTLAALDEGAVNLGVGARIITAVSIAFVVAQLVCCFKWAAPGAKQALRGNLQLVLAFAAYSVLSLLGTARAGSSVIWDYWSIFTLPFVLVMALENKILVSDWIARTFGVLIVASLPFALVFPQRALWTTSEETIVAMAPRFAGLTAHANSMGFLAGALLIVAYAKVLPKNSRILFWISSLALLASQSKTAIAGTAVALAVMLVSRKLRPSQARPFQVLCCALLAGLAATSPWWLPSASAVFSDERLSTLTGRTEIWAAAIELWRANPWVGNGVHAFDANFRWATQLTGAESAHNQVLDTLVSAGLVGFISLAFLMMSLVTALSKVRSDQLRALAAALICFIFIRFFTEATLRFSGPGISYVIFVLTILILMRDQRLSKVHDP